MMPSSAMIAALLAQPLVAYYISVAMVMLPAVLILRKTGLKDYYAAVLLIPWFGTVVFAAILALNHWPVLPLRPKKKKKDTRP